MSRDWTPAELYYYTKESNTRNMKITYNCEGEDEIELGVQDEEMKAKYPEFCFLFNHANTFITQYKDTAFFSEVLDEVENQIQELEKQVDNNTLLKNNDSEVLIKVIEMYYGVSNTLSLRTVVMAWFAGVLDADFYYSNINDDRFYHFLETEIKARGG